MSNSPPSSSKKPKPSRPNHPQFHNTSNTVTDPRFTSLLNARDPRFRLPSKRKNHVSIDPRFAHMLHDEQFSSKAKVDRYGRKLPKGGVGRELESFYGVEEDGLGRQEVGVRGGVKRSGDLGVSDDEESREEEEEESSTEDSSSDEESVSEGEEEVFGMLQQQEQDGEGIPEGQITSRLAVVNLDWDHIRAADLMVVLGSFVPSGRGRIERVVIYPSEFGRERMEREEVEGPPTGIFESEPVDRGDISEDGGLDGDDAEEEDADEEEEIKRTILKEDAGVEFNSAKLRRYQLERLRYHYAVVTCSSPSVAQSIYDTVDGTEYLTTANFFDLRFIPDETDFSDDKPRDECERIPDRYRPTEFVTDALQHSKVRLTWDADDTERREAQKRAFKGGRKEVDENDLKAYLGSDSSDDDDNETAPEPVIVDATNKVPGDERDTVHAEESAAPKASKKELERQKMRALLGLSAEPVPRKSRTAPVARDMQVTFTAALTGDDKKGSVFENTPQEAQETTAEKYIRKEKERKAKRKEKMKAKREDDVDAAEQQPSEDREQQAEEEEDLGFDDPFFTPTTNSEKTSTAKEAKGSKKNKRRQREAEEAALAVDRTKLESLIANNSNGKEADVEHFDIKALARAEKVSKKGKNGKKHLSARDKEALEMQTQDKFEMDVKDDRFKEIFERPEFAVDPSHPRFLGTEGMRKVLEEGRRVKGLDVGDQLDGEEAGEGGKRKREGDELGKLVKRVKRKGGMR